MKMKDENLAWQHISTETILHDRWMDMRKSEYRLPDGKTAGPFYTFSRKDYAVIVATDTEGNYILVRQYRQGIRKVTDEFPAGGIESGIDREYRMDFYTENGLPVLGLHFPGAKLREGGRSDARLHGVRQCASRFPGGSEEHDRGRDFSAGHACGCVLSRKGG